MIMRPLTAILLLGTAFFLVIAARCEEPWQKIENDYFSFSLPAAFKKTEARGKDSFVEEYLAEGMVVRFDYGKYSNKFGGWPPETKFEDLKINGKTAKVGTTVQELQKGFPCAAQVNIPLAGGLGLTMFAACKSEKELEVARRVFETITFKKAKP